MFCQWDCSEGHLIYFEVPSKNLWSWFLRRGVRYYVCNITFIPLRVNHRFFTFTTHFCFQHMLYMVHTIWIMCFELVWHKKNGKNQVRESSIHLIFPTSDAVLQSIINFGSWPGPSSLWRRGKTQTQNPKVMWKLVGSLGRGNSKWDPCRDSWGLNR